MDLKQSQVALSICQQNNIHIILLKLKYSMSKYSLSLSSVCLQEINNRNFKKWNYEPTTGNKNYFKVFALSQ